MTGMSSSSHARIKFLASSTRPDVALVKSMRDVLAEFWTHPESKSADQFGGRSTQQIIGLLHWWQLQETFIAHAGKEANRLKEVDAGLVHDADAVQTEYERPGRSKWDILVLPRLRSLPWDIWSNAPSCQSDPYATRYKGTAPSPTQS